MLVELNISNFAIIDELKINFTKGLNIITGETGAGKSILIEAIGIILGSRSNRDYIQTGQEKAVLEGVFYVEDIQILRSILEDYSIDVDDDKLLIITKEIYLNGPSISKVNGRNLNLTMLRRLTSQLVDIFGQHEHQSLLDISNHILLVDSFGDKDLLELKSKVRSLYQELKEEEKKLISLSVDSSERDREIDILKYQIQEIDEANLTEEDEDSIESEYRKLSNVNTISQSIEEAINYFSSEDFSSGGLLNLFNRSLSLVDNGRRYDGTLDDLYRRMEDINYELQDINRELVYYLESIDVDAERLYLLEERINLVNRLRKKYGKYINNILEFKQEAEDRLEKLLNHEKEYQLISKKIVELKGILINNSEELSSKRKKISKILEGQVREELNALNMLDVNFKIGFKRHDEPAIDGYHKIEFLISTNPGEDLKPLSKIISGGEMSRIMLAFKSIVALQDKIPTLIFDEIDSGISGRTAQVVGEKIDMISKSHQLICISHLPQIAAFADSHFLIDKVREKDRTRTRVQRLSETARVEEMARLLGGANLTKKTLEHASEMIEMSKKIKKS